MLQLDERYLAILKECSLQTADAITQLIRFYANFSRTKTPEEAYIELGNEFLRLADCVFDPKTQKVMKRAMLSKRSNPREPVPETPPSPDQLSRNALR